MVICLLYYNEEEYIKVPYPTLFNDLFLKII